MAGTIIGGFRCAATNKRNNPNFYKELGKKGGSVKHPTTRTFYLDRKLAAESGSKGGKNSKCKAKEL